MTKEFSNSVKLKMLEQFVELCGRSEYFEKILNRKGFFLFRLIQEYEGAFDDVDSHYKYMQELGKETVGSYDGGIASFIGENSTGYQSPHLQSLAVNRNKRNGMNIEEFRKTNPSPWLLELDKSRSERLRNQITSPVDFYHSKSDFDKKFAAEKKKESSNLEAKDYSYETYLSNEEKFDTLVNVLSDYLGSLGMSLEKKFSSKKYPIYCKNIDEEIYLCCGIKNYEDLLIQPEFGTVELIFHLRTKDCKISKIELSPHIELKGANKLLVIQSGAIVPYFIPAYSAFSSIKEYELNILAQISLFKAAYNECEDKLLELIRTET
ncbi:hypothetical protein [Pseudoalteromonas sp. PPB1]|uniref:hypothetical protein n=1 Tax=Pseudoalteromonas sp. PPB1 TaxID=2756136 RepID=UPI0018915EC4|nr:hypothetical protein [Pseudoalteromonas sp. PPB1]